MGRIADAHRELYHYTTAAGLAGILESKSLWATHTSFMNDEEEILGFYDRILPKILRPIFDNYVGSVSSNLDGQTQKRATPSGPYVQDQFQEFLGAARIAALMSHDHYVASFATTTDSWVREHGLLSQWRAYGPDGGYALVLGTESLDKTLSEESTGYQEEIFSWADVQYKLNEDCRTDDRDTNEWIERLEVTADKYFRSGSEEDAGELSGPLTILSCIFKHRGFEEENEVRFVLSLLGSGLESHPDLASTRQHPVKTRIGDGTTVPFVELCVQENNGVRQHLPIKRIIVGPHRDKHDRKRAVQLLLKQHGLSAEVSVSDIPYRGR